MMQIDKAQKLYYEALRNNPHSIKALTALGSLARSQDQHIKGIDFFKKVLQIEPSNGAVCASIGHCYLMCDDLQNAYTSYQNALYYLSSPRVTIFVTFD